MITQSVVQPERVKLDFRKYAWIGIATPNFRVCYGYGRNGVKSWDDMMHRKQFILGADRQGIRQLRQRRDTARSLRRAGQAGPGLSGQHRERLAVERGELDGDCGSLSSIPAEWLRDDKAHVFVRFTKERPPEMPESARFIEDFATTQDQKDLLGVLDAEDEVGRSYVMSADVPADRIAIMRKAFDDTMKDPAFLAETEKEQLPVHPLTGEEAGQIVAKMMTVSPAIIARAKKMYE